MSLQQRIQTEGLGPFHVEGLFVLSGSSVIAECALQVEAELLVDCLNAVADHGSPKDAAEAAELAEASLEAVQDELQADVDERDDTIKDLEREVERLKNRLDTAETTLEQTEELLEEERKINRNIDTLTPKER